MCLVWIQVQLLQAIGTACTAKCLTRSPSNVISSDYETDQSVLLADAVIVNYSTRIKDIFQQHGSNKDILFSTDYGGHSIINAGGLCSLTDAVYSHCTA